MDALIFNTLRKVQAETDEVRRAELMAESSSALAAHFSKPQNRGDLEELAFELFNNAWTDATKDDVLRRVIEVKTVGLGETDYIEENLAGMRAYWQGKGGQILSDVLRYERSIMPREEMVSAIDMHQDELALDFWGSFTKLVAQIREKFRALPVERLVELIQEAVKNGVYYGEFATATLTAAQVDSVVDEVALKSDGQVSIIGTRFAVRKLAKVGLEFGDNLKEQVFRTGQIGIYKGYPVIQVENSENFEGNLRLPNDELWIPGRNAGRLTYYGSQVKSQTLPRSGFYTRFETARDAGMLLFGASKGRVGRIKLT